MTDPLSCHFCDKSIEGDYIALDFQCVAHKACYALEHPFEPYMEFEDLIIEVVSSKLLRKLLVQYIPPLAQGIF